MKSFEFRLQKERTTLHNVSPQLGWIQRMII